MKMLEIPFDTGIGGIIVEYCPEDREFDITSNSGTEVTTHCFKLNNCAHRVQLRELVAIIDECLDGAKGLIKKDGTLGPKLRPTVEPSAPVYTIIFGCDQTIQYYAKDGSFTHLGVDAWRSASKEEAQKYVDLINLTLEDGDPRSCLLGEPVDEEVLNKEDWSW